MLESLFSRWSECINQLGFSYCGRGPMMFILSLQETDLCKLLLILHLEMMDGFSISLPIFDLLSGNSQKLLSIGCVLLLACNSVCIFLSFPNKYVHEHPPLNAMKRVALDLFQVTSGEHPISWPDMRIFAFVFSHANLSVDMLVDSWQRRWHRDCVCLVISVKRHQILHVALRLCCRLGLLGLLWHLQACRSLETSWDFPWYDFGWVLSPSLPVLVLGI